MGEPGHQPACGAACTCGAGGASRCGPGGAAAGAAAEVPVHTLRHLRSVLAAAGTKSCEHWNPPHQAQQPTPLEAGSQLDGATVLRYAQSVQVLAASAAAASIVRQRFPSLPSEIAVQPELRWCPPERIQLVTDWRIPSPHAGAARTWRVTLPGSGTGNSTVYGFSVPRTLDPRQLRNYEFSPSAFDARVRSPGGAPPDAAAQWRAHFLYEEKSVHLAVLPNTLIAGADAVMFQPAAPAGSTCRLFSRFNSNLPPFSPLGRPIFDTFQAAAACKAAAAASSCAQWRLELPRAITVAQRYGGNFYHWTIEALSRLLIVLYVLDGEGSASHASMADLAAFRSAPLIVTGEDSARGFVKSSLRLLGFDRFEDERGVGGGTGRPNAVFFHDGGTARGIFVRELLTAEWWPGEHKSCYYGGELCSTAAACPTYRGGMETQPPRGALWMVRAALVAAAVTQPAGGQRPLLRVVYTSRCRDGHFAHRRVPTNEKAMLDDLRVALSAAHSTAVEVVSFHGRETPFAEAVQVFGSADVVLGVHGAALSNAVFCRSGTALVEVTMRRGFGFPIGFRDYAHLAAALDLSYYAIPLDLDYSAKVQLPVKHIVDTVVVAASTRSQPDNLM